jgi:hypothetical protein
MADPTPEAARELLAEIDAMPPYHPDLLGGRTVLLGRRCRPILSAYAEQAERIAKLTDSSPGTLRGRFQGMLDEIVRRGIATGHEGEPPESKLWKYVDRMRSECEAARDAMRDATRVMGPLLKLGQPIPAMGRPAYFDCPYDVVVMTCTNGDLLTVGEIRTMQDAIRSLDSAAAGRQPETGGPMVPDETIRMIDKPPLDETTKEPTDAS